jgi:hypothetical protein
MDINLIPSDRYYDYGWGLCSFLDMVDLNGLTRPSIMNSPQPLRTKIIYSHICYLYLRSTMLKEKIIFGMRELVLGMPSDSAEGI